MALRFDGVMVAFGGLATSVDVAVAGITPGLQQGTLSTTDSAASVDFDAGLLGAPDPADLLAGNPLAGTLLFPVSFQTATFDGAIEVLVGSQATGSTGGFAQSDFGSSFFWEPGDTVFLLPAGVQLDAPASGIVANQFVGVPEPTTGLLLGMVTATAWLLRRRIEV